MEFDTDKCTMLVMKSGKRHMTEGIKLPNQEKTRTLGEKESYKYLGILEADTMHKALHRRNDLDRLYVSRKEGEGDSPALKTAFMHQYNDSKTR